MKFILLSDLGIKPTRAGNLQNNSRSSGALHIVEIANSYGIESTNIDYWREWGIDNLRKCIVNWFGDDPDPWIGLSGSIDGSSTQEFKHLVHLLKREIPNLKVILGGYRVPTGESDWVDFAFIGRSGNIFSEWLQGNDLEKYVFSRNPLTYKNPHGKILEKPVSPMLQSTDFWSNKETHTIELALGCKFNCSFCGYDFRNNKNPVLIDPEQVFNTLTDAYNNFGITNFVLADDTINEIDDKLILLGGIVEQLDFEPNFMAFVRADVLAAKPHQIELLQQSRINSMFFGIESLNPNVTKTIRKGGKPERMFSGLKQLKRDYPEAFTYGNLLIGLTGDSEKDIWRNCYKIVNEQILTSAGCNSLRIYENLENPDVMSDIDKNPQKFGYDIIGTDKEWAELGYSSQTWKNDWITTEESDALSLKVDQFLMHNLKSYFTAHEIFGMQTMLPNLPHKQYNDMINLYNRGRNKVVANYIEQKSRWMLSR